jgi:two-component system response regulator VicR
MRDKDLARREAKESDRLITTGEAASHCQVSLPTLRRWIRDGRLTACQTPGKHARIEVGEFQHFLRAHGMRPYPRERAAARARVLVVEDEPEVLQILTQMLAAHSERPTVETAVDGYEALIKVGIFKPSFLILDLVMPKLDGLHVCRRLKANPETRDIKILAVTGRPDMVQEAIAAGADRCVTKPFSFEFMDEELERFLGTAERADLLSANPLS